MCVDDVNESRVDCESATAFSLTSTQTTQSLHYIYVVFTDLRRLCACQVSTCLFVASLPCTAVLSVLYSERTVP